MATLNRDILHQYLDTYRKYLSRQKRGENARPLSNVQEDYKRGIAVKAAEILKHEDWTETQIGEGAIGGCAIKAVQRNLNLIGRFQVSGFADKVRENFFVSERLLYDLYHERKDQECFDRLCELFGRKYDLIAYLYSIIFLPGSLSPLPRRIVTASRFLFMKNISKNGGRQRKTFLRLPLRDR